MKTTKVRGVTFNGQRVLVTTDGMVIRLKKTNGMKSMMTRGSLSGGYREVGINNKLVRIHRLVAMAFLPEWDESLQVDHIDGNKSNNRLENLRMATNSQNLMAYCKKRAGASSQFRGVCWDKQAKQWRSYIKDGPKLRHIGLFSAERDAAISYNEKAVELGYFSQALNIV